MILSLQLLMGQRHRVRIRLILNDVVVPIFRARTVTEKRQTRTPVNLIESIAVVLYIGGLIPSKRDDLLSYA